MIEEIGMECFYWCESCISNAIMPKNYTFSRRTMHELTLIFFFFIFLHFLCVTNSVVASETCRTWAKASERRSAPRTSTDSRRSVILILRLYLRGSFDTYFFLSCEEFSFSIDIPTSKAEQLTFWLSANNMQKWWLYRSLRSALFFIISHENLLFSCSEKNCLAIQNENSCSSSIIRK